MLETAETKSYRCEHCGSTFIREASVLKHLCEQKRRWNELDTTASRIAYDAWVKVQQRHFPSKKKNEPREFIKNSLYLAFARFGQYCVSSKVVNPEHYITWLLRLDVKIDRWVSDKIYEQYLMDILDLEDHMDAVRRGIDTLLDMCEKQSIQLRDAFRLLSANNLCFKITTGKISPWILYNCDSGVTFLGSINEHQLAMIDDYIKPDSWTVKLRANRDKVEEVRQVLKAAGL
jgi:hypothetical protein